MLIFNAFAVSNNKSQIRQFHVDSNDDYEAKIKILEPSDTALIAEYPAENNIVLNIRPLAKVSLMTILDVDIYLKINAYH